MKIRLIAIALVLCFSIQAEEAIDLAKVPAKAIAAAKAKVKGIELIRAEVCTKDSSGPVYELEGRVGQQGYELKVTAEGKVLYVKKENGVPIKLSEIPAAVKKAAEKVAPGLKITEAELKIKGQTKLYEIEGTVGKKKYELLVEGNGKLRKLDADDDEDDDDDDKADKDDDDDDDDDDGDKDDDDDDDDDEDEDDD